MKAISLIISAVASLEYHSAVSQLQRLLHHETLQLERLNEIFDALEEAGVWVPGMKTGKGWMHGVQANLEQIYNERDLYMSHNEGIEHLKYPLNQFRLLRRYQQEWFNIQDILTGSRGSGVDEDWIRKVTNGIDGRQIDLIDLERAARGLSRLSTVYDIPLQEIKSNMINSQTLSLKDLVTLGNHFKSIEDWNECALWLDTALQTWSELNSNKLNHAVMFSAQECFTNIGQFGYARYLVEELIDDGSLEDGEMNILYDKVIWLAGKKTKSSNSVTARKTHQFETFGGVKWDEYKSLCQQKLQQEHILPCKEEDNLKIEILSESPDIVRYLDVYSEDEVTFMESIAEDLFPGTEESKFTNRQTIFETDSKISQATMEGIESIKKRISSMVSLDPKAETSISNFGTGGHYVPHPDKNNTWWGELSTTEGGALVFPSAKIYVEPIAGSAIFWSGLKEDLTVMTCPIISGIKWTNEIKFN